MTTRRSRAPHARSRRQRARAAARPIGRRRAPDGVRHRLRRVRRGRADDRAPAVGADRPLAPVEGPDPVPEPALPGRRPSTGAATAARTGRRSRRVPSDGYPATSRAVMDATGTAARRCSSGCAARRLACRRARRRRARSGSRASWRSPSVCRCLTPPHPWRASTAFEASSPSLRGLGQGQPARLAARLRGLRSSSSSTRSLPSRTRPSCSRTSSRWALDGDVEAMIAMPRTPRLPATAEARRAHLSRGSAARCSLVHGTRGPLPAARTGPRAWPSSPAHRSSSSRAPAT